jgi:hypothetical protein
VVNATVYSGINIPVPLDIAGPDFELDSNLGATAPALGDTYRYKVEYVDGSVELLTSAVTGVLNSVPLNLAASSSSPGSVGAPLFSWQPPASPPVTYSYRVVVEGSGAFWDYHLPGTTLQTLYNADGLASPASLATGTYPWWVQVFDAYGNSAKSTVNYTVP